jgi:hypothetical protein
VSFADQTAVVDVAPDLADAVVLAAINAAGYRGRGRLP